LTLATFDVISATLLPSPTARSGRGVESSMALFQRAGGWGLLYAILGAPQWLPRPGLISGARATVALRASVAALLRERRAIEAASGEIPDDLLHRLMRARDPESGSR